MPYQRDPRFFELLDVRQLGARLKSGLNFPTQVGFLVLLLMIGVGSWISYRHMRRLFASQELVAQTHRVVAQVRDVHTTLLGAESGVFAFVITGLEQSLEPYAAAAQRIEDGFEELVRLTEDDPGEQQQVLLLRERARARLDHLDRAVKLGRTGDMPGAALLIQSGEGRDLMEGVRKLVGDVEGAEYALLERRDTEALTSYWTAQTTGILVGAVGCLLVLLVYQSVRRFDRLRDAAARDSADARERYRVTLASIGDAVLVTDNAGRLTFCNQAGGPMLSIGPEVMGRPLAELLTFVSESTGEARPSIVESARTSRGVVRTPRDTALHLADGRTVPVGATAATILDASGREEGVVLVVRDVSDRRDRERELARSNERFRSLVLAMSQVVWTMDADGSVQEDSPSWRKLTGRNYEQWKGRGWLDAVHPEDRERVEQQWNAALEAKRAFRAEYRLQLADGSFHWTTASAVPVLDLDRRVREWVGMSYDIQAQKEAEEAERDAQRRKDEFIALLAHELRNPLAPIRHGMEVLKHGSEAEVAAALPMMDRQMRHMMRLIDDLLDVSRISHGKLELRLERFDLRDVVRQSADAARPDSEAKQQRLSVDLPDAPLWVEGDPVRLAQVVTNLLGNSVKYSGPEASIWVRAEHEGARQLVTVRDTGQGIAPDLLPRIWDLFLQGSGRIERREGGLGIGLTLVKRLVEMHGGSVLAASDGVGQGSEFQIRLPAAAPPRAGGAAQPSGAKLRTGARTLRILIIDDNEDSAESLSMLMRLGGHTVRTAYRGDSGLEEFETFRPELILCDIRMPGMNGFEFARRLRSARSGRPPFLVALTGFGTPADREASIEAGFDRHLVKPVDPEALTALLRDAVREPEPRDARL